MALPRVIGVNTPPLISRARSIATRIALRRPVKLEGESDEPVTLHVDELVHHRGWLHVSGWVLCPGQEITGLAVQVPGRAPRRILHGLDSPDVAEAHGPAAASARFSGSLPDPDPAAAVGTELVVLLGDGRHVRLGNLIDQRLHDDPCSVLARRFYDSLAELPPGARVLELGSRARSGNVLADQLPFGPGVEYTGFDIIEGRNVDVVGDAHALADSFEPNTFAAAFSVSTFEHLAMPWKVAVELATVLEVGATAFVATHQTWPVHDEPWDFWRFSAWAWASIFNADTGFEVIQAAMGEPAAVVSRWHRPPTVNLDLEPAWLSSSVLVRKVGEPRVSWDVATATVTEADYPV